MTTSIPETGTTTINNFHVNITMPPLLPDLDLPSTLQGQGFNLTLNATGVGYHHHYYFTNGSGLADAEGRGESVEGEAGAGEDEEVFYPLLKQPGHMVLVYALAYGLVTAMALVGNGLVMGVVSRKPSMHSVTNYFLFNLALADLLVAVFCVPVNLIANLYNGWQLGALMCKAAPYLQGVATCASVNTLAAIALDRYLAICHTLEVKISRGKCKVMLFFIWLTAVGVMVPWLVFFRHRAYTTSRQHLYVCYDHWPSLTLQRGYYVGVIFVCCYSLPLAMITVCYSLIGLKVWRQRQGPPGAHGNSSTQLVQRSRVRVLKMLVVVCVLFSLSWLPLYAINFWRLVRPEMSVRAQHVLNEVVVPLAQWLSSSNCCMNPIVYCFFSKKFREGFRQLLGCCGCSCGCDCAAGSGPCRDPDKPAASVGGEVASGGTRVRFSLGSPDLAARTLMIRNGSAERRPGKTAVVFL